MLQHKRLKEFKLFERLDFAKVYLNQKNSIILVEYLENTVVNLEKGQLIIDTVYPLIESGIKLGMTDATAKNIDITSKTRKLYSSNKSMNLSTAHAVVVKDLHIRMLANLFIRFDNPTVPTKVFNSFDGAVHYLESL